MAVTEKEDFLYELKLLKRIRDLDNDTYRKILMDSKNRDRRPEKRRG